MPKIRAIVFDHYGTLADIRTNEEKGEIFRCLSLYLQYYGAHISERTLKSSLGLEKQRYLKAKKEDFPEIDLEIIFKTILKKHQLHDPCLSESCCKLFRLLSRERFQLFPDALPVLKEMKSSGYPLALVSDAQKVFALEEVKMLGLDEFFPYVVLSTYLGFRKPDPRLFAIAYSLLQIPPAQSVYIGDNPAKDIAGAKKSGMQAILVRNSRHKNQETQADFYAEDLWEAWDWIQRHG
jgi:putative hydrolase of the HAD superfamily